MCPSPAAVAATVLIPTHTHGETLRYSLRTALYQTVDNIEIFIVGDAVPDITRRIAAEFMAADSRVRFFDFPKGASRGESYRHAVLQEARGAIVCYLFDDDLWLPDHIAIMQELLATSDFAFSTPVVVRPGGELSVSLVDLERPLHRRLFTNPRSGTASVPTCAAHRLAAYRRLPHGWHATPLGLAPDKYFWAQFLSDKTTTARSTSRPTAILFPDPPRRHWPLESRLAELERWSAAAADPAWREQFVTKVAATRSNNVVLWLYAVALQIPIAGPPLIAIARRIIRGMRRHVKR
jgi:glycosyltransferase involved in cell wall biosynthesis